MGEGSGADLTDRFLDADVCGDLPPRGFLLPLLSDVPLLLLRGERSCRPPSLAGFKTGMPPVSP